MNQGSINEQDIDRFRAYLIQEEKSPATTEKYVRDVRAFLAFAGDRPVTKELVMAWKERIMEKKYTVSTVNSMLASLNSLLNFLGLGGCKVKSLKAQRRIYCAEEKELTKEEYLRLLDAAGEQSRLRLVMEAICGTGIRVSELKYFTLEAVKRGEAEIHCKGKIRVVLIPGKLRKRLLNYAKKNGIRTGAVFITKHGNPLDRSNIWRQMKRLCKTAGVASGKVFPHNLRRLFARVFYGIGKDIAKLADILGHSSINTTRIYIMTTGSEHRRQLERLELVT